MAPPARSASASSNGNALLSVRGVSVRFGGIVALDSVSFDVARGDICGLIGPNGAGKTTLFNCMSRLYQYQAGDILMEGQSITNVPIHRIAGLGLGRTFQNLAMFRTLSVTDNVMVGAHARSEAGFASSALRLPKVSAEEKRLRERAHEIMAYLGLLPFAKRAAGDLPFNEKPERKGTHGHDPNLPELHASFLAWGAGIKPGTKVGEIANTQVTPTIAKLMGLEMSNLDGKPVDDILSK